MPDAFFSALQVRNDDYNFPTQVFSPNQFVYEIWKLCSERVNQFFQYLFYVLKILNLKEILTKWSNSELGLFSIHENIWKHCYTDQNGLTFFNKPVCNLIYEKVIKICNTFGLTILAALNSFNMFWAEKLTSFFTASKVLENFNQKYWFLNRFFIRRLNLPHL